MSTQGDPRWERALALHRQAAAALLVTARAIPDDAWSRPLAVGKWTPAQVVDHLNRAYDIVLDELAGRPGMAIRTGPLQRRLLRLLILPRLLRGAPFPAGAVAPRETRPDEAPIRWSELIAGFEERATRTESVVAQVRGARPGARVTHAYFGSLTVPDGLVLCARHIEHHQRQLDTAG